MWLLFGNHQEVLLLALLHEKVFVVEEVGSGENLVRVSELFLVDAHATTLSEFAHLAFGREDWSIVGGEFDCFHTSLEE